MLFILYQYDLINVYNHHEVRTPDGSHVFPTIGRRLDADLERIRSSNSNILCYDFRWSNPNSFAHHIYYTCTHKYIYIYRYIGIWMNCIRWRHSFSKWWVRFLCIQNTSSCSNWRSEHIRKCHGRGFLSGCNLRLKVGMEFWDRWDRNYGNSGGWWFQNIFLI